MGGKNKKGGGGENSVDSISEGGPNNSTKKSGKKTSYTEKYLSPELYEEIVYDSPDINRTLSLYSRPDLYKCMIDFLSDLLPDTGFVEDGSYVNARMALTVLGTAIGIWSVSRLKYPKDKEWVLLSVVLFFILTVIVAIIDLYATGPDTFFILKDKHGKRVTCGMLMDDSSSKMVWTVRGGSKQNPSGEPTISEQCVSRYFDSDGYLVVENLFDDFCEVVERHCGHLHIAWEQRPDYNLEENYQQSTGGGRDKGEKGKNKESKKKK